MLGALDYYGDKEVRAYQILVDEDHWTLDVPNLEAPWTAASEPVWRWLFESWPFAVPRKSIGATNLNVLRGRKITQVARWEEDLWEAFAGAEVNRRSCVPFRSACSSAPTTRFAPRSTSRSARAFVATRPSSTGTAGRATRTPERARAGRLRAVRVTLAAPNAPKVATQ